MAASGKVALIGDLHGHWDDWDVEWFNLSDYHLILFTGDLGSGIGAAGVKVARSIARLAKPALVMPGNNDVRFQPAIAAEFAHQRGLIAFLERALASAAACWTEPPARWSPAATASTRFPSAGER